MFFENSFPTQPALTPRLFRSRTSPNSPASLWRLVLSSPSCCKPPEQDQGSSKGFSPSYRGWRTKKKRYKTLNWNHPIRCGVGYIWNLCVCKVLLNSKCLAKSSFTIENMKEKRPFWGSSSLHSIKIMAPPTPTVFHPKKSQMEPPNVCNHIPSFKKKNRGTNKKTWSTKNRIGKSSESSSHLGGDMLVFGSRSSTDLVKFQFVASGCKLQRLQFDGEKKRQKSLSRGDFMVMTMV